MTSALIAILVKVVVAGLAAAVLFWGIGKIALPEPFNKIAVAIVVLLVVAFLLDILLGVGGHPLFR